MSAIQSRVHHYGVIECRIPLHCTSRVDRNKHEYWQAGGEGQGGCKKEIAFINSGILEVKEVKQKDRIINFMKLDL